MEYPKSCFSIREDQTARNKREYVKRLEAWYKAAEELFPDYYKLSLRERMRLWPIIDEHVGYHF